MVFINASYNWAIMNQLCTQLCSDTGTCSGFFTTCKEIIDEVFLCICHICNARIWIEESRTDTETAVTNI